MSRFTRIDLSELPAPDVIEPLDFETMLAAMKAALFARYPAVDLESEPLVALLEVVAYYRMLDRARVNDAAKAVLLAKATGADLDNIGAFYGAARLVVIPGDPEATPPTVDVYEGDVAYRGRLQLAIEAQSTAGPRGAYLYWALAADGQVLDASVSSPTPGTVRVVVLAQDGVPGTPLLDKVYAALNAEDVRPLCDTVTVVAATVVDYAVTAQLTYYAGPDKAVVAAAARAAVEAYAAAHFRLGHDITRSGLFAALHQVGVQNVTLTAPAANVVLTDSQAPRLTTITLTDGGIDV